MFLRSVIMESACLELCNCNTRLGSSASSAGWDEGGWLGQYKVTCSGESDGFAEVGMLLVWGLDVPLCYKLVFALEADYLLSYTETCDSKVFARRRMEFREEDG